MTSWQAANPTRLVPAGKDPIAKKIQPALAAIVSAARIAAVLSLLSQIRKDI
jgi:hypothetical protein